MRKHFIPFFVLLGLLLPATASAQYVDRNDNLRFEEEFDKDDFMITARGRMVAIPGFMLGLFFDDHANNWSEGQSNFAWGGEFVWRRPDFEIGVSVEYADLSMKDQFWLEADESLSEADWTEFNLKMLSVVVATYWYWDVNEWFAPYVGGGLGPGFMLGEVLKYNPRVNSPCAEGGTLAPNECFDANGEPNLERDFDAPEKEDIPFVLPVLNVTGGMRFNIAKYGVLKLEVGFHDYVFAGMNIGGQW